MDVELLHTWATWLMLVTGPVTFVATMMMVAPYGRYSKGGNWGPLINAKVAWVLWELPALLVPLAIASSPPVFSSLIGNPLSKRTALFACYLTHYTYRPIIYPLLTRNGKPAPLSVALLGGSFCVWNGFVQGWMLVHQMPHDARIGLLEGLGLLVWLWGWTNVVKADWTLINLRRPGETGYKIPRGGLFEFVSAANYAAEIIEWTGYAIAAQALPAAAFALFTFSNIGPRGWRHHKWYLEKFEDYPKNRKAVVPFIW